MIYRLENKIRSKGKNSDNMLLNEFIIENKKIFQNWIRSGIICLFPNSKRIDKPYFFISLVFTEKIINQLQDNKIPIIDFLKEIKKLN